MSLRTNYSKGLWKAAPTQQLELNYRKLIKNHLKRPDVKHVNDWHEKDMNKQALNVGVLAGDAIESLANMIRNKQVTSTPATPTMETDEHDQNSSSSNLLMTNKTAAPDDINPFGNAFENALKNKDKKPEKFVKQKKQDGVKQTSSLSINKPKKFTIEDAKKELNGPKRNEIMNHLRKKFNPHVKGQDTVSATEVYNKDFPLPHPIKKVNPTFKSQIFKHVMNHKLPIAGGIAVAGALGTRALFKHLNKSDDKKK